VGTTTAAGTPSGYAAAASFGFAFFHCSIGTGLGGPCLVLGSWGRGSAPRAAAGPREGGSEGAKDRRDRLEPYVGSK